MIAFPRFRSGETDMNENREKVNTETVGDKLVHSLISLITVAALSVPAVLTKQPALNVLPLAGVAAMTSLFGGVPGIVCAVVTALCSAYTLSEGNDFVTYSQQGLIGHIAIIFAAAVCVVFVSRIRWLNREKSAELERIHALLEESHIELETARTVDAVTTTRNRYAFRRDYGNYKGRDVCLLMLDIDKFKRTNDTYGHAVGDFLLKRMGESMRAQFGDEHCYRYGGDEFLVVCPEVAPDDFIARIEKLREAVASIRIENADIVIRFSAGCVYGSAARPDDLRLMIRHADFNLYEAKDGGKNRTVSSEYSREFAQGIELVPESDMVDLFGA